jgi:hypothetical protein
MASSPQPHYRDEEFDTANAQLPGYTVDAFLAEGKVDKAREELERLLLKGLDSGNPCLMTDELLEEIVAKARARAAHRTK